MLRTEPLRVSALARSGPAGIHRLTQPPAASRRLAHPTGRAAAAEVRPA